MSIISSSITWINNNQSTQLILDGNQKYKSYLTYIFSSSLNTTSSTVFWLEDFSFNYVPNPRVGQTYFIRSYNRQLQHSRAGQKYLFYLGFQSGNHRFVTRSRRAYQKNRLYTMFQVNSIVNSNTIQGSFQTIDNVGWFQSFGLTLPNNFTGTFSFSNPGNYISQTTSISSSQTYPLLPVISSRQIKVTEFWGIFQSPYETDEISGASITETNTVIPVFGQVNWVPTLGLNNYVPSNQIIYQDLCGGATPGICTEGDTYSCVYDNTTGTFGCQQMSNCYCPGGICVENGGQYQCINNPDEINNYCLGRTDLCSCGPDEICIVGDFGYQCKPNTLCNPACAVGTKCVYDRTNGARCEPNYQCNPACPAGQECVTNATGVSSCVNDSISAALLPLPRVELNSDPCRENARFLTIRD